MQEGGQGPDFCINPKAVSFALLPLPAWGLEQGLGNRQQHPSQQDVTGTTRCSLSQATSKPGSGFTSSLQDTLTLQGTGADPAEGLEEGCRGPFYPMALWTGLAKPQGPRSFTWSPPAPKAWGVENRRHFKDSSPYQKARVGYTHRCVRVCARACGGAVCGCRIK